MLTVNQVGNQNGVPYDIVSVLDERTRKHRRTLRVYSNAQNKRTLRKELPALIAKFKPDMTMTLPQPTNPLKKS
jgi:hypothetical protein